MEIQKQAEAYGPPLKYSSQDYNGGELYTAKIGGSVVVAQLLVLASESGRFIGDLWTHPQYRRRGIATALWRSAGCPLQTPNYQTGAGKAWAESVGGKEISLTSSDLDSIHSQGFSLR